MNLSTVARVKALITSTGTANAGTDAEIAVVLATVSEAVEAYLDRETTAAAKTEYFDIEPWTAMVRLRAFPVSALTSVHYDEDQVFGSDTLLTSSDYYDPTLDRRGSLRFKVPFTPSDTRPNALKVIYTGGMAADAASFVTAYPDIAGAVDVQTAHEWQRRGALGVSSINYPDGTTASMTFDRWIPSVKQVLDHHRRMAL